MRRIVFLALVGSLAFAGCNGSSDTKDSKRTPGDGDGGETGGAGGVGPGLGLGGGKDPNPGLGGDPEPNPGAGGSESGTGGNTGEPPTVDEADVRLFSLPDTMPRIDLTVSAASEASLRADPDTYVEGSFRFSDSEGTVGPWDIGVRGKGRYGSARTFDEKMAFKLDFNRLVRGQKLFGLGKLNLNNMVQDASCVHEWLSYQLFQGQGVPAPRAGYARVYVNDVEFGVYLTLEATDDEGFLERNFPSTSVLYEGEYGQDLFVGSEGEFDEDAGDDPLRVALTNLTNLIATTLPEDAYETLADAVHWDEVVSAMATEIFIGHWDGYAPTRNNYFLHFDDEARASLIPWGTDQTFSDSLAFYEGQGLLLSSCLGDQDCRSAYSQALSRVSNGVQTFLDNDVATLRGLGERLATAVASDPRFSHDPAQVNAHVEEAIAFLQGRIVQMDELMECLANPEANDTDSDGYFCGEDCAEGDAATHPGAEEICGDRIDQDCNGFADDGECPSCVEDSSLGETFVFCRIPVTHADAANECSTRGGSLVKLTSASEAAAVASLAATYFSFGTWWLGVDDIETEGTFVWSAGGSLGAADGNTGTYDCGPDEVGDSFCDFGGGEPNDSGGEDCVTVSSDGSSWNDLSCDATQPFVCSVSPI
jgi:hypothetical protein